MGFKPFTDKNGVKIKYRHSKNDIFQENSLVKTFKHRVDPQHTTYSRVNMHQVNVFDEHTI